MHHSSLTPCEYYHLSKNMTVEGDVAMLIRMIRLKKNQYCLCHIRVKRERILQVSVE